MSLVVAVLALGSLVALMAAARPRLTTGVPGEQLTGAGTPAGSALALVVLAGTGALLLARRRGRRALGVVLAAAGLGTAAAFLRPVEAWSGFAGPADQLSPHRSAWAWLGAAAGLLVLAAGAAVVVRAGRWPLPRRSFEGSAPRAAGPRDAWDALDRGEDPTA
jgi:hypothetical protein